LRIHIRLYRQICRLHWKVPMTMRVVGWNSRPWFPMFCRPSISKMSPSVKGARASHCCSTNLPRLPSTVCRVANKLHDDEWPNMDSALCLNDCFPKKLLPHNRYSLGTQVQRSQEEKKHAQNHRAVGAAVDEAVR